jgi:hypothetical protein|tara:strand:+ start:139 stop:1326 length:1188 start_codon:yes stop_codon:yes gene_type:complete
VIEIPKYNKAKPQSKEFSKKLLNGIENGTPVHINRKSCDDDFQNNLTSYVSELYKSLEKNAYSTKNFEQFKFQYVVFKETYDIHLRWDVYERYVDFLLDINRIDAAIQEWIELQEEEWAGWNVRFSYRDQAIDRLIQFEQKQKSSLINGYYIEKMAPKGSQLTSFGKRNINEVLNVVDTIINTSDYESFFNLFYSNYSFNLKGRKKTFPVEHYDQFFLDSTNGRKTLEWYKTKEGKVFGGASTKEGLASQNYIKIAIRNKASSLLREAENEYRKNIGAKKIGEAWISETELFYKLKTHFSDFEVIHHGKPQWLGRQHFDIWIPDLNCAIEYQGQQHDQPIDFFGGEKAFKQNQQRDRRKREKAVANNITLIEVRPGYNIVEVIKKIKTTANTQTP